MFLQALNVEKNKDFFHACATATWVVGVNKSGQLSSVGFFICLSQVLISFFPGLLGLSCVFLHLGSFLSVFKTFSHVTCLTFVTQQSSPVDVTHTLPGFDAASVLTARERQTVVTQRALPAIMAPEEEKFLDQFHQSLYVHTMSVEYNCFSFLLNVVELVFFNCFGNIQLH